ncbi:hypothetical protein Rsub_06196 [Raphidocelis subcapitata]|uniref:Photolyase/cryptochrome alpha/beta domain-containing protein n=1 Tax=Raphidocelis subcapitata TaxID=307507 RepID=A0A2V0P9V3_9CHLO|nr:hypothetical protein Rsub_06196 [Raphidocelis subcapitata]|eukprot:GBF93947.1 hypothetical protein Rsub_06196 [Raphidocelis subcapitata]
MAVAVVLLATATCGSGAAPPCAALQPLAGRPALAYWLDVLSTSPRLQPLAKRLAIVASTATEAALRAYADAHGLADRFVVVPEAGSSSGSGVGGGLATALEACQQLFQGASHIVVADGARALEPGTNIARMVQAAVVQADAATAGVAAPLDAPAEAARLMGGSGGVAVELASPLDTSSRIVAVRAAQPMAAAASGAPGSLPPAPDADATPWARGPRHPALAPVCVLARRAVDRLLSAGGKAGAGAATVGELLAQLLNEGLAVRAWRLELQQAASASTSASVEDFEPAVLAKCTLLQLEERLSTFGIHQAAAFVGHGSGGDGEPYGGFREVWARWLEGYLSSLGATAANPFVKDYKQLPDRQAPCCAAHACYTTSSADYGARRPTPLEMPPVWAGVRGKFTEALGSGPPLLSTTFKTHTVRSRVHRALDEL